jgi:two-component system, NarL family, response regulator DesR
MTARMRAGRTPRAGRSTEHDVPLPTAALAVPGTLMAEALGRLVREAGLHVVGCYGTLGALLEKIRRCRPQIVIADADLRVGADGADAFLAQQREAGPSSKLVVLTGDVDGPLARALIAHDAAAVILKSSPTADALAVLRQVLHDRTSFPAAVLARLGARDDPGELSCRQLEVLEELALGRSNDEIARRLYISVNTVKFHLNAIYDRLGVHNRVEAAGALAARRAQLSGPTRPGG